MLLHFTARDVEEKLVKDTPFKLWVPDIEAVYSHLTSVQGFEPTTPSVY